MREMGNILALLASAKRPNAIGTKAYLKDPAKFILVAASFSVSDLKPVDGLALENLSELS